MINLHNKKIRSETSSVLCLLAAVSITAVSTLADNSALTPFVLPWDDTSSTIVSAADMNSPIKDRWVRVSETGHLVLSEEVPVFSSTDIRSNPTVKEGERIRFMGMNMTFTAGFPPRDMASKVAGRLAKFGFNGVRFHHIDNNWHKMLIDYSKGNSRTLSKEKLDDFHYFISQLKANGIYTDLNLLVSRLFLETDGFPAEISQLGWKNQHILGYFNDHALALQKEYATSLLTSVNPYTGLTMAKDPAIAFVEIINENGIIQKWTEGVLDELPSVFKRQLQTRWNEWLQKRYNSLDELKQAWNFKTIPVGKNMLKNSWNLEVHSGKATMETSSDNSSQSNEIKISVLEPADAAWHIQLNQPGLSQSSGQVMTLSFKAKADQETEMNVSIMQASQPYSNLGLNQKAKLSPEWKQYTYTYLANSDEKNIRPNFGGFALQKRTVWLSDVQLHIGGTLGNLPENASLKEGNIPIQFWQSEIPSTIEARQDWLEFLISLENRYYTQMCTHLREECGYLGLIFGTILANSPAGVQAKMDIVDSHGYWQHPQFPGSEWDSKNWIVNNISMITALRNTFTSCALQKVYGKPFFCTEYQHPAPNQYSAEGPLIMGAYAALQDWDGYWFFDYGTGNGTIDMGRIDNFFSSAAHSSRMANLLFSSYLFRRGDVAPAKEEIVLENTPEKEIKNLLGAGAWGISSSRQLGMKEPYSLRHRVSMSLKSIPGISQTTPPDEIQETTILSDTGELRWETTPGEKRDFIQINTSRSKALLGFTDEREFTLGDISIRPGKTRLGWSTIGITLVEGESFDAPSAKALIIATGQTENTDMLWKDEKKNSVGHNWGKSPVLTECVPFEMTLPVSSDQVLLFSLDPRGNRLKQIPIHDKAGKALLKVNTDSPSKTFWYEVVIKK